MTDMPNISGSPTRAARRTAHALGRLITLTIALTLIATGIATADGTILPAVAWITGLGLTLRVLHVAASKESQS